MGICRCSTRERTTWISKLLMSPPTASACASKTGVEIVVPHQNLHVAQHHSPVSTVGLTTAACQCKQGTFVCHDSSKTVPELGLTHVDALIGRATRKCVLNMHLCKDRHKASSAVKAYPFLHLRKPAMRMHTCKSQVTNFAIYSLSCSEVFALAKQQSYV